MSIIIDEVTVSTSKAITFDGNTVEKVVCNGVTIWELQKDITLSAGNYGGVAVTGAAWQQNVSSRNGDKAGVVYTIAIPMDLSIYKKIQVTYGIISCEATADNSFGFGFRIRAGSQSTNYQYLSSWHGYRDDNYQATTANGTMTLNVSGVSGQQTVYIDIMVTHGTSYGVGNGNGSYKIYNVQFLT